MSFKVKVGPKTTKVRVPLIENMARAVARIEDKIDLLLSGEQSEPYIEFTIGPIREQSNK